MTRVVHVAANYRRAPSLMGIFPAHPTIPELHGGENLIVYEKRIDYD